MKKNNTTIKPAHKKPGRKGLTIEDYKQALIAEGGYLSYAAKRLGVTTSTVQQRIEHSPELQAVRAEYEEKFLDTCENSLATLVKQNNLGAICFSLKCKGHKRGWIEKNKIEVEGNVNAAVAVSSLPDDKLAEMIEAARASESNKTKPDK